LPDREKLREEVLTLLEMVHDSVNKAAQEIHFTATSHQPRDLEKARSSARAGLTQLKVALEKIEEHDKGK
jgi:hypothetical protein